MKGLLKNNFLGVIENIKILFPLVAALGIVLSVTGDASLLHIFSFTIAPILSVLAALCLRKETLSKWYKYKISLPVKRKTIVQSYYISHLCWCLVGMLTVTLFMSVTVIGHGNQYFYYGFRDAVTLILGGGVLSVFVASVFYPLYYYLGSEKIEITAILSLAISIGFLVGISMIINIVVGDKQISDIEYYMSLLMILGITGAAFLGSYFLSVYIFQKKEY